MEFLKLLISSLCLIVLLHGCCCATATKADASHTQDDTTRQSTIYKIKRLGITKDKHVESQRQLREEFEELPLQQHHEQKKLLERPSEQRHKDASSAVTNKSTKTKKYNNQGMAKNPHGLNKKMLNKLGFTKVKAPNSHNRKRLAIESRHHASPDDSHMFIIKLPPNFYYYTSPKTMGGGAVGTTAKSGEAAATAAGAGASVAHNSLMPSQTHLQTHMEQDRESLQNANGKKVLFPFNSNGKPGRIYHWNLPVIKKILEDKQRFPNVPTATKEQLIDIKDLPTWTKPWENETIEKSYGKSNMMNYKKSLKRKSPSYYAPANAVNKNSFNKYFSGNGKPKGFYVIKDNQKKPLYYKNIVS